MDAPANQSNLVVCPCHLCGGGIEFDSSQVGESVTCPHCNAETVLFVPPASESEGNPPPLPPPTIEEIKFAEAEQRTVQKIIQIKSMLRERLEGGRPAFLYEKVFLPVDSEILDKQFTGEFDVGIIRRLGLLGWEVIQAVPKTKGIGLENVGTQTTIFGSMWAGGVGGNVMGVYIILKKPLSAVDITDDPADEVGEFIRSHLSDFAA
ncbi:MAG: hypothetical protein P4L50_07015 [Anaerolineaceae bacterium]|nr:hypothetical protein [Anaerolineaceae bacterium]